MRSSSSRRRAARLTRVARGHDNHCGRGENQCLCYNSTESERCGRRIGRSGRIHRHNVGTEVRRAGKCQAELTLTKMTTSGAVSIRRRRHIRPAKSNSSNRHRSRMASAFRHLQRGLCVARSPASGPEQLDDPVDNLLPWIVFEHTRYSFKQLQVRRKKLSGTV